MNPIQIKDKQFAISIPEADILREVDRVAAEINRDLAGKNPLFLSVLNGSFMFTADLMKRITIPCEISFVKGSHRHHRRPDGPYHRHRGGHRGHRPDHATPARDIGHTPPQGNPHRHPAGEAGETEGGPQH